MFYQTLAYFAIGASFMGVCFHVWFQLIRFGVAHKQKKTSVYVGVAEDEQQIKTDSDSVRSGDVSIKKLVRSMIVPIIGIFLTFGITLAIFPVITVAIPCNSLARKNKLGTDNGWWSIGVMTTFMIFDYVGRQLPKLKWAQCFSLTACLCIAVARVLFFGLFTMEAIPEYTCTESECTGGPVIRSDIATIVTMLIFALTNGWISSVIMMKFQETVKDETMLGIASNIQSFALNSGLFAGGLLSLAV